MLALARRDGVATVLVSLVLLTYLATWQGWNVWLVGGSHRWASGVILVLGIATCSLGSPTAAVGARVLGALGALALVLALIALLTGSLSPLSLLTIDLVALWAASTLRHLRRSPPARLAL